MNRIQGIQKILNINPTTIYNNSSKIIINNNSKKSVKAINIKKIPPKIKSNYKRSKSTKSFSMNNSNKSNIKRNIIIQRNSKKLLNYKNNKNSSKNKISKSEFYKKINIVTDSKSYNKTRRYKNNSNSSKLSKINEPAKLKRNNELINQSNPMELTFGSSSNISNNMQTETNETEEKNSIKIKNKFRKKNSFIQSFNLKKEFKEKNDLSIMNNKIVKLNKKLFINPSWKIRKNHNKYKPLIYNQEPEKSNKSSFVIINYNEKSTYSKSIDKLKYNINNITDINSDKIAKNKKSKYQERVKEIKLKAKFINFTRNNLLKNELIKKRNNINIDAKNNYGIKKINLKRYSLNVSSFFSHNLQYNNKIINNINQRNQGNKLKDSNEYIIKINKSVDKENGKFKLIIKRTVADKCIRKMPKSTPKLLLSHPSFKKMFF